MFQQRKLTHLFSQVWCLWSEHILKNTCAIKTKINYEKTDCKFSHPYSHDKKHNTILNGLHKGAPVVWKYL